MRRCKGLERPERQQRNRATAVDRCHPGVRRTPVTRGARRVCTFRDSIWCSSRRGACGASAASDWFACSFISLSSPGTDAINASRAACRLRPKQPPKPDPGRRRLSDTVHQFQMTPWRSSPPILGDPGCGECKTAQRQRVSGRPVFLVFRPVDTPCLPIPSLALYTNTTDITTQWAPPLSCCMRGPGPLGPAHPRRRRRR